MLRPVLFSFSGAKRCLGVCVHPGLVTVFLFALGGVVLTAVPQLAHGTQPMSGLLPEDKMRSVGERVAFATMEGKRG